jgi:hypothetical protein
MPERFGKITFFLLIWNLKHFRGSASIKDKNEMTLLAVLTRVAFYMSKLWYNNSMHVKIKVQ